MSTEKNQFWILAVAIILLKVTLIIIFGPIYSPDSYGYVSNADSILNRGSWIHSVNLGTAGMPETAFRSVGYPAVIALFKLLHAEYFDWLLLLVQVGLSLVVSALIYRLSMEFFKSFRLAAFCAIAHAVGMGGVLDHSILTDSLNASAVMIIICLVTIATLKASQPTYRMMLGLGLLLAFSFLIREAGAVLQYLIWPFIFFWLVRQHQSLVKSITLFVVFIAPIFATSHAYKSWNEYRSGERFITTAGQTTMYFPAFKLYAIDILPYKNDEILRDVPLTPESVRTHTPMENVRVVNQYLFEKYGMDALERAHYGYKVFFNLWVDHPLPMLKATLKNIRGKITAMAFMPVETYITMSFWSTWDLDSRPYAGSKDLIKKVTEDNRYDLLALYIIQSLCRLVSMVMFVAFVIGSPIILLRCLNAASWNIQKLDLNVALAGLFWALFMGYTFAYALVSFELRYVIPVVPFGMIAGLLILINLKTYLKTRKLAKSA